MRIASGPKGGFMDNLKIKKSELKKNIAKIEYKRFGHRTTVCFCVTIDGFELVGTAFCANVEEYNEQIGQETAFDDCLDQLAIHTVYKLMAEDDGYYGYKKV